MLHTHKHWQHATICHALALVPHTYRNTSGVDHVLICGQENISIY